MKFLKLAGVMAIAVLMFSHLTSAAPPWQESLRTAEADIKKFTSRIKRGKNGKLVISSKLGAQDYAFAEVKVNNGWKKLSSASRLQTAKSWWDQWATSRARYESWVGVTITDSRGKELNHCFGDTRGEAKCSSNGTR